MRYTQLSATRWFYHISGVRLLAFWAGWTHPLNLLFMLCLEYYYVLLPVFHFSETLLAC